MTAILEWFPHAVVALMGGATIFHFWRGNSTLAFINVALMLVLVNAIATDRLTGRVAEIEVQIEEMEK